MDQKREKAPNRQMDFSIATFACALPARFLFLLFFIKSSRNRMNCPPFLFATVLDGPSFYMAEFSLPRTSL